MVAPQKFFIPNDRHIGSQYLKIGDSAAELWLHKDATTKIHVLHDVLYRRSCLHGNVRVLDNGSVNRDMIYILIQQDKTNIQE